MSTLGRTKSAAVTSADIFINSADFAGGTIGADSINSSMTFNSSCCTWMYNEEKSDNYEYINKTRLANPNQCTFDSLRNSITISCVGDTGISIYNAGVNGSAGYADTIWQKIKTGTGDSDYTYYLNPEQITEIVDENGNKYYTVGSSTCSSTTEPNGYIAEGTDVNFLTYSMAKTSTQNLMSPRDITES